MKSIFLASRKVSGALATLGLSFGMATVGICWVATTVLHRAAVCKFTLGPSPPHLYPVFEVATSESSCKTIYLTPSTQGLLDFYLRT